MDAELLKEFLEESLDNLSSIDEEITRFEKDSENSELLNSIFRKVHTLKGSAGFLGYKNLQELTHAVENNLSLIRDGELSISTELVNVFLDSIDKCLLMLDNISKTTEEGIVDYKEQLAQLVSFNSAEVIDKKVVNDPYIKLDAGVRLGSKQLDEVYDDAAVSKKAKEPEKEKEMKAEKEKVDNVIKKDFSAKVEKPKDVKKDKPSEAPKKKVASIADSTIKVNVKSLDRIMNVVGELVLTRNQILQLATLKNSADLAKLSQQLNNITTELQTDIMMTRMQPIGTVLNKFERVIRDLSRSQGKKISVEITGKETELDKSLLEGIKDPLTHLVRNSADHGIELPEKRVASGKSEEGKICLRAYHEGGMVIIEIEDDGQGIDSQKIISKALEKGLIKSEEAETMSDKKAHSLLFLPGFSTAEQVTNISGRGVGMDVVKTNIEKMGGSIEVLSEKGNGSIFRLKIPLTLAIIPALIVKGAEEFFAIPQINLIELVRFEGEEASKKIEKIHDSEFFRLRGELISLFRLNSAFNLEKVKQETSLINKSIEENNLNGAPEDELSKEKESVSIVVLRSENQVYGLIVDDILDTQEIVVKPLAQNFSTSNFAGATIMGDGKVALILDTVGFYNDFGSNTSDGTSKIIEEDGEGRKTSSFGEDIILFKLADDRAYSIPLSLVNRLEEFNSNKIEWSGDQPLIRYRETAMPLINIEERLDLKQSHASFSEGEERPEKFDCLVIVQGGNYYGLVVSEIVDITAADSGDLATDVSDREGILGTYFVNEKIVSILNVDTIINFSKNRAL